ncbi:MAG: enoyl-CoA hydratase/isomerase family protein [Verrucomicrobia bacterium]|nr:enoyl-CoA hydratase/isomerase family protein [Verrucomicrobiota bacterium]
MVESRLTKQTTPASQNIRREVQASGVAILTFDRPKSSANIFDGQTFDELSQHLDFLESEPRLNGLIIRSAKAKVFVAGADLNVFTQASSPEQIAAAVAQGQKAFGRIAKLPYPVIAAIHGVALGGGLELALACDYRVASLDPATKLGLPETTLGLLPAWGGTMRLPKLTGLPTAIEAILTGRQYPARQALKLGLVDAVAPAERIIDLAMKLLLTGKRSYKSQLSNRAPLSKILTTQAQKRTLAKTRGNYPAPLKALEVVVANLSATPAQCLENEKKAFVELACGPAAQNLIRVFFLQERAKKVPLPAGGSPQNVSTVLVLGAGIMGAGIAQWLSARGIRVILKDVGPEPLGKGIQSIAKLYRDGVKRRVFTEAEARQGFDRVLPVVEDVPLGDVDLVIEAAVEKLEPKKQIFATLDQRVQCETVATNTSALSIDAIADGLIHPERVVGIHFFNPVHRMQLVEVVVGPHTSAIAQATAIQFVKGIGKQPVVVKDSPGFLVNRVLVPYMVEAIRLFAEGHRVEKIDKLMLDFGMPMGPLRLNDEVGLDVSHHVAKDLAQRIKRLAPLQQQDALERMMAKGWLGRKSGRGFYDYSGRGAERRNPQLNEFQPAEPSAVDEAELRDRLVLVMVNEAARCLEEGVVQSPDDVDFGMIMGTGWAPFRGGPLKYADSVGIPALVNRLNLLCDRAGEHFSPCALLAGMANRGATFYPKTPNTAPLKP